MSIQTDTVVVDIALGSWSGRKKMEEGVALDPSAGADPAMVRSNKLLLDPRSLRPIQQVDATIRKWIAMRAVPVSFLRGGMSLLPLAFVPDLDTEWTDFSARRGILVREFLDQYPSLRDHASVTLGALWNAQDYPESADLEEAFSAEIKYLALDVPAALETVSAHTFRAQRELADRQWRDAEQEIRQALRESLLGLISHMRGQLSPREDGRQRRIATTMLDHVHEFLNTFSHRNLTDDRQLADLVDQARQVLTGVHTDDLRQHADVRGVIREDLSAIETSLTEMVETAPRRRFDLSLT